MLQEKIKMNFNREGKEFLPLATFPVNGKYIIGVYRGSLSPFDILIKYRQLINSKWSYLRTPKHIHWAVDILIKMNTKREITKDFLDFLIGVWNKVEPMRSEVERENTLKLENLLSVSKQEYVKYEELGKSGEYSVNFLILLAKLLMLQEKTNMENAYMFKSLLDALKKGEDIFSIVSIASHTGRR